MDLSHLEPEQTDQLRKLLDPELYQEKPGFTTLVQQYIILKEEVAPCHKSHRIPEHMLGVLREELDIMLSLGVFEPSASEWCSPVILVPIRDGSIRFYIDFRRINALTKADPYPMPWINDLVERLGNAKYISTVDLSKGYW